MGLANSALYPRGAAAQFVRLVAFLEALTDPVLLPDPRFSDPFLD